MKFSLLAAVALVFSMSMLGCGKEEPQTGGYGVPEQNAAPRMDDKDMKENRDWTDDKQREMNDRMDKEQDRMNDRMDDRQSSSIYHSKKQRDMYDSQYTR
ncbi:hypothetical protein KS4_28930 [Poriferisphaera corsica]|uniref:Uncharacterized protein n=1 Tax=Poriferisphaera corsica TaxID=2528020 RepID=A0A517YX74_9BACT|nr:hypothetical protein [Poriferisphaera corsica]QDU34817.1 hypothetical protein KS4_28930 [Poriferisphaera corsica]